jgi:membrane protease YdiL (CAAX protease family)
MEARRVLMLPPVRILAGLVLAVALLVPAQLLAAGASPTSVRGVAAELYTGLAVVVALWLLGRFAERRSLEEIGLAPDRVWQVALGFGIGGALAAGAVGLLALTGSYSVVGTGDLSGSAGNLLLLLAFELGSAALQAVLFYGVVFRILVEWLGPWPAVALSVILFGLLHLSAAQATVFSALVAGVGGGGLLALAYLVTRAVWLPLGILWGLNFLFAEVLGAIPSSRHRLLEARLSGSDLLTGGQAGVEGGAVTLAASAVVIAAMVLWRRSALRPAASGRLSPR